jgi:hypothetical protein
MSYLYIKPQQFSMLESERVVTDEFIDIILENAARIPTEDGAINDSGADHAIRKSKIAFFPVSSKEMEYRGIDGDYHKFNDIHRMAADLTEYFNKKFNFDIDSIERLQYAEYHEEENGFYDQHVDIAPLSPLQRKLSFSLQLSDEDSYEGGDLEVFAGGDPIKMPRKKGTLTVFPSFVVHRVAPVTKGVRKSLVWWATGPAFK